MSKPASKPATKVDRATAKSAAEQEARVAAAQDDVNRRLATWQSAVRDATEQALHRAGINGEIVESVALTCKPGEGVWDHNFIDGPTPLLWKRAPPKAALKTCSICKQSKSESDFSGAQLKLQGKRRCADCVARIASPSESTAPTAPHILMFMNCAEEADQRPFVPSWEEGAVPAEFSWLAADAPVSHTPPDSATLASRRAIVQPFFRSGVFAQGQCMMLDSTAPYFTSKNGMKCERMWVRTAVVPAAEAVATAAAVAEEK